MGARSDVCFRLPIRVIGTPASEVGIMTEAGAANSSS